MDKNAATCAARTNIDSMFGLMCWVGNRAKHLKDPRDASRDTYMQQQRGENLFRPSRVTGFSELGSLEMQPKYST